MGRSSGFLRSRDTHKTARVPRVGVEKNRARPARWCKKRKNKKKSGCSSIIVFATICRLAEFCQPGWIDGAASARAQSAVRSCRKKGAHHHESAQTALCRRCE